MTEEKKIVKIKAVDKDKIKKTSKKADEKKKPSPKKPSARKTSSTLEKSVKKINETSGVVISSPKKVVLKKISLDDGVFAGKVKNISPDVDSAARIDLSEKRNSVVDLINESVDKTDGGGKDKIDEIDLRVAVNKGGDESQLQDDVVDDGNEIFETNINIKKDKSEIDLRKNTLISEDGDEDDIVDFDLRKKGAVADVLTSFKNKEAHQVDYEDDDDVENGEKDYNRPIGIYRKMAYFFIFLVVLLVAAVAYLTSVKVMISIIPNQERVGSEMIFDVYNQKKDGLSENSLNGLVEVMPIEYTGTFESTGIEVIGKDATGIATLVNNYNRSQILVATTRLLTSEGELFRTRETVNIPAGGSVEVEIYADDPRADIYVPPTKLTIPGLWAGLQDQIYAETKEEITYKQQVKKHVAEVDMDNSVKNIRLQLEESVKQKVEDKYGEYSIVIYEVDKNSIKSTIGAEEGDEKDEFSVTMGADVVVVAFDKDKASKMAENKFFESLPDTKELINFDSEGIKYVVSDYDKQGGIATVNAIFEGRVSLKNGQSIVNKEEILELNKEQIEAYILSKDEVAGVDVKFYPPFVNKIPRFIEPSRISIEIKN